MVHENLGHYPIYIFSIKFHNCWKIEIIVNTVKARVHEKENKIFKKIIST